MSISFNLIDQKWIPVLYQNGSVDEVGVLKALKDANRIHQIAASNPMDRIAVLRFLLAILYWCKGNPDGLFASSLPMEWFLKLNEATDYFNLLGDGKRFYQYKCKDSKGDSKKLSANYLVQEVPTGTNMSHFRHSIDGVDGLCPACCVLGLLRLPLFATSGGRGKPPGVNSKPPIYAMPMGDSLAETLLLSWQRVGLLGKPFWEEICVQLPKTVPLLTGLTWVPRRVWLDDPGAPKAACRLCGRVDQLIRLTVFAPIGSQKMPENERAREWHDPHVIYEKTDTSLHAADALHAYDAAAGQWNSITSGLLQGKRNASKIWYVGFATVQNDKYLEAMEHTIPFPGTPDERKIQEIINKMEQWQKNVSKLSRKMRLLSNDAACRKHVEIASLVNAIRPHIESRIFANEAELLDGGENAWQDGKAEYDLMLEAIGHSISPGFTVAAVKKRSDIASVLSNMWRTGKLVGKVARK